MFNKMDFSKYPKAHPLFDNSNTMKPGMFKEESYYKFLKWYGMDHPDNEETVAAFYPKPKSYAIFKNTDLKNYIGRIGTDQNFVVEKNINPVTGEEEKVGYPSKVKAKGVPSCVAKELSIKNFENLMSDHNSNVKKTVNCLRSVKHIMYTMSFEKKVMDTICTKRFSIDGINTRALGHPLNYREQKIILRKDE